MLEHLKTGHHVVGGRAFLGNGFSRGLAVLNVEL